MGIVGRMGCMKRVGRAGSLGVAADVRVTGVKAILYAGRPWAEACGEQVTWMVSCLVSLMGLVLEEWH